jgi:PadR family transcriptional regulator PadR
MAMNRELLRGSLELMVLSTLRDGAKYGYLIQKRLNDVGRGEMAIQAGSLYPVLYKLEDAGAVRARWDESGGRRRKWYELTEKGRKRLEGQILEWQFYAKCVLTLLGYPQPEPSPAVA